MKMKDRKIKRRKKKKKEERKNDIYLIGMISKLTEIRKAIERIDH